MVKKELTNKKVVRAIALGLSAVMLTTPMTAMAAEPTGENENENNQIDEVASAINEAQNTIIEADANVPVDEEIKVVLPGTVTEDDPDGKRVALVPDAVEAARNAELDGVKTTVDGTEITYADVVGEAVEKTETTDEKNTGLLGTNAELEDAEDALSDIPEAEAAAQEDIDDATEIIEAIETNNTVLADANVAAQAAAAQAAAALTEAEEAQTQEAAQAAVDKATEALDEATAAQTAAQAAFDENEKKLAEAWEALNEAKADLTAAQLAKNTTEAELKAAQAAVDEAAANAEALKAQVDADAAALEASDGAALKAAYIKMKAQAVYNQYSGSSATAPDADGDKIADEFSTGFGSESASGDYWEAADAYFELYLKYVYGKDYVKGEWKKNNSTLLNPQDPYDAERDNTFIVYYYNEQGEVKEACYNYHTDADAADKGDITIYEKKEGTGWTQPVYEKQDRSETTYSNELSIAHSDGSYTTLSSAQKNGGVENIVTVTETTDPKTGETTVTSVLVKDANSQLLNSEETQLAGNQTVVEGSSKDTYTVGTIRVPASYGTKEVEQEWRDCISYYDDLVDMYEEMKSQYSADDGYVVRMYIHHFWSGEMQELYSLDEAEDYEAEAFVHGCVDRGYEIGVYKVVEDTNNVTEWADQQVIVKTTKATVETTTQKTTSETKGDRDDAERAAAVKVQELGLEEGTYSISYKDVWDGPFDKDCKYTITYNVTTTSTETIKTEKYTGTAYNMNSVPTTRTWQEDVLVEGSSKKYEYWTERRNTANDDAVEKAMRDYEIALEKMKDKQDAAAIALAAALQAKADVEKAQAELEDVEVDKSAYNAAVERLQLAQKAYEEANGALEKANDAVEDANGALEAAEQRLEELTPVPSTGGERNDSSDDEIPAPAVVPVPTPVVLDEAPVAPMIMAAAPAVVNIDDEATPLAGGIDDGNGNGNDDAGNGDDEVIVAEAQDEVPAIVAIEDEETPLAAGVGADGKMSWWWLLIVALLGATGYKMYKDHQKKKEEAQEA